MRSTIGLLHHPSMSKRGSSERSSKPGGRPAHRFPPQRTASFGTCRAPRRALSAHTFARADLGITAQLYRLRCRLYRLGRSKQLDLLYVRRKIAQRPSRSSETISPITVRKQIPSRSPVPGHAFPGPPDNIVSTEPLRAAPPRWAGRN